MWGGFWSIGFFSGYKGGAGIKHYNLNAVAQETGGLYEYYVMAATCCGCQERNGRGGGWSSARMEIGHCVSKLDAQELARCLATNERRSEVAGAVWASKH